MRSWIARHPISFMALYTVFYLTAFHWLEVNITVPAIWVHCQLDDVIPFCKYAIVPYFAWFAWIPFTLFYLLRHGERSDFWRVCLHRSSPTALCCWRRTDGGSPSGTATRALRTFAPAIRPRTSWAVWPMPTACRKSLHLGRRKASSKTFRGIRCRRKIFVCRKDYLNN